MDGGKRGRRDGGSDVRQSMPASFLLEMLPSECLIQEGPYQAMKPEQSVDARQLQVLGDQLRPVDCSL